MTPIKEEVKQYIAKVAQDLVLHFQGRADIEQIGEALDEVLAEDSLTFPLIPCTLRRRGT